MTQRYLFIGSFKVSQLLTRYVTRYINARKTTVHVCRQVAAYSYRGWLDRKEVPETVKPYYSVAGELCIENLMH